MTLSKQETTKNTMMQEVVLRTGIWYNDRSIKLTFPDSWDVVTYWPDTPQALTDDEILRIIDSPIEQPPLRSLAEGKQRPLIIIDDLTRPTPVYKIMPFLLEQFNSAGVHSGNIRILVATGTHGNQDEGALTNKIGKQAMDSCRVIVHNDRKDTKFIGKTSFGTPVYVNKEVLNSDLIIGIGGIYPQHTTGFGGGSKLSLGVLGRKSIMHLHYGHTGVGGTYDINNDFRRDVTEIARMIGLNAIYTLHVNAHLELVNIMCGDHFTYYPEASLFSRQRYAAQVPDDADVVIANAYPFDSSYTFMRKGYRPLDLGPREATKVMIASNHEGIGTHGLFQHIKPPRFIKYKMLYRKISVMEPRDILSKIFKRLKISDRAPSNGSQQNYALPEKTDHLWVYRPNTRTSSTPPLEGISVVPSWNKILEVIEREQLPKNSKIRVRIYPCAPLQCLDLQMPSA